MLIGKAYVIVSPRLAGTLGGTLFEFATTFGVWIAADRFHLSAILAVVAFAMTVARYVPERQSPRDRIHSYSVWETTVFLLNVLAFLLMGLQARAIVNRFDSDQFWQALGFAGMVLVVVVVVRLAWVLLYNRSLAVVAWARGSSGQPGIKQGFVVAWCGMRGLVTLATALALPVSFPARDLIVLSAFVVVLGTLIAQGLTLAPLLRVLRLPPDELVRERALVREIGDAGRRASEMLGDRRDAAATRLRADYQAERAATVNGRGRQGATEGDHLRFGRSARPARQTHGAA